jgi:hypothetical protein
MKKGPCLRLNFLWGNSNECRVTRELKKDKKYPTNKMNICKDEIYRVSIKISSIKKEATVMASTVPLY